MTSCGDHYTPHTLAFALSESTPPHLIQQRLERCSACRAARDTLDLWARRIGHADPGVWPEYSTAPHLLTELLALPHRRRLAVVRFDELFQHWGLFRLALEDTREVGYSSPAGAHDLAELALAIAMNLPEDYYGAHPVADQRALAWANLAHVQAADESAAARRSGEDAERGRRRGTGAAEVAERWRGRGTGAADVARRVGELLGAVPVRGEEYDLEEGDGIAEPRAAAGGRVLHFLQG